MNAIREIKKVKNHQITIHLPENFEEKEVEVIVLSLPEEKKYDFSDLAGKLEWQGDPVEEQRRIRNEW